VARLHVSLEWLSTLNLQLVSSASVVPRLSRSFSPAHITNAVLFERFHCFRVCAYRAAVPSHFMRWIRYGSNAMLITFSKKVNDEAFQRGRALVAELEKRPPAGLVEFVPAFTTLLLEFDPRVVADLEIAAAELMPRLKNTLTAITPPAPTKEIPVRYDGEDLEHVAKLHGLTITEVAELHAATIYKVYMLGFAPGFPYLGELDSRLHTPRLATPRPRVRAGSVAIGGEHTGIYSVDSPGGWNIIGHTSTKLFDPTRRESAIFFLRAGDRVKFIPEKTR
jgi:KipI family sensor histidine kinase inhibitor